MSQITRSTLPALVSKTIYKNFTSSFDEYPTVIPQVCDVASSDGAFELYQEIGGFRTLVEKNEGAPTVSDSPVQGPETKINNIAYALSYTVTYETLSDCDYSKILNQALEMGSSAAQTREIVAANILNEGFSSYSTADGETLFSTIHPLLKPGNDGQSTFANRPTIGSSLSEASLTIDMDNIAEIREPGGLKQYVNAESIIVPQQLNVRCTKILNSELEVDSSNNAINVFARNRGMLPKGQITWQYLTDPDAYFIRTSVPGYRFQEREPRRLREDMMNKEMAQQVVAYMRFGVGVDNARSLYGNPGA